MSNRTPDRYVTVDYLDSVSGLTARYKRFNYHLLGLRHAMRVLEVGRGPGTDTLPMAKILAPEGNVIGIDRRLEMLVEADRRSRNLALNNGVLHVCACA